MSCCLLGKAHEDRLMRLVGSHARHGTSVAVAVMRFWGSVVEGRFFPQLEKERWQAGYPEQSNEAR